MSLHCEVSAKTDVGCVRIRNEDSFGYDTASGIFVVCDGVGGQAAGDRASKIAVDSILNYLRTRKQECDKFATATEGYLSPRARILGEAIQVSNQAVWEAAKQDSREAGMACTLACAFVDDRFFAIGHVGDTRVYLIRGDTIQRLTRDHSLVEEQVRLGFMTRETADTSAARNVILRALGSEETVRPDLDELLASSGDFLLLASDGLTTMVGEQEILQTVTAAGKLEEACSGLIQLAKRAGGIDNITCLLIRFSSQPWYRTVFRRVCFREPKNGKTVSQI